jgi:hypothetical protein
MKHVTLGSLAASIGAGLLLGASAAHAVDGVIEINDASIVASGGYPLIIGLSGSYVLTGNLTPTPGADAINVFAPNVTIDLNGFQIDGAGVALDGIDGFGFPGLTVQNGSVSGFIGVGVAAFGAGSKIFNVRASASGTGISGAGCLIVECTADGNGTGIQADRCKVENNIIQGNGLGLFGLSNVIVHNQVTGNGAGGGIITLDGSTIQENVILMNGGFGISDTVFGPPPPPPPVPFPTRVNIRGNTINGNGMPLGGPGISFVTPALITENTVSSNTGSGIICGSACTVNGNLIDSNNTMALVASGGAIVGAGSNVTGNSISFNTGFGLMLPLAAGYSNNTFNANTIVDVASPPHPTAGFNNLCSGLPGPSPLCP